MEIRLWPKAIGADYLIARTGRAAERVAAEALSEALGGLPLGLAHGCTLKRKVPAGSPVRWADVKIDTTSQAVRFRREMEKTLLD